MAKDPIQFTTFGVLPPGGLWECPQADGRSEGCVPVWHTGHDLGSGSRTNGGQPPVNPQGNTYQRGKLQGCDPAAANERTHS